MIQKLLTVGTSRAVTVPKNALKELGLQKARTVSVRVDTARKRLIIEAVAKSPDVDADTVAWTKKFVKRYRPALEALSKK